MNAAIAALTGIIDDLVTLLDACDLAATMSVYAYAPAHRAMYDAHDLGHRLTGGDTLRKPWPDLRHLMTIATAEDDPAAPDVTRRVLAILDREVAA